MNIQSYNPSFQANVHSSKLDFKRKDFYVRISGYGTNRGWANVVRDTADIATYQIRHNDVVDFILRKITAGVVKANILTKDLGKIRHTGILRDEREFWRSGSTWTGRELTTNYSTIKRYATYGDKFDYVAEHPLKKPYDDMDLTVPIIEEDEKYLRHANPKCVNNALTHIYNLYKDFKHSFNCVDINDAQLPEVNAKIGEIRWLMAHATPWERGSDTIANVFMRAMYKSLGIKTYPLAKGVSLDLEAYCTELNDYKKNFGNYFEKPPKIIE